MQPWRQAKGFTLPELLVALAIGSLLMLAIADTQISIMRSGARTSSRDTRLEAVRNGLDRVVEDLRLCSSPQALTNVLASQSGGVTTYTGTVQPAGTAGTGLMATCPAGGSTSYTYAVLGGLLMRSDGANPPIQVAANVDQMSFLVDSQGLITMTAITQPSAGNPVVVPTKVMPRVATVPVATSPPPPPACGLGQAAWQKHWFSATTPTFSGNVSVTGDLFTNGNLQMSGGSITGTGWATGSVSGSVGTQMPNQGAINQPTVNWAGLQNDALQSPNTTVNGDWTPSGTLKYAQPTIIYVSGNLTMTGSNAALIKGVVTIVVAGQVSLTGNASLLPADSSSSIAILSQHDLAMVGFSQLHALVYAQNTLSFSGNATLTGVGVGGQIQANGNPSLVQDPNLLTVQLPDMSKVCPG